MKYLVITLNTGEEVAWIKSNDEECIRDTMMEITKNDYKVVDKILYFSHRLGDGFVYMFSEGYVMIVEV